MEVMWSRLLVISVVVVLIGVNLAALHDILVGEPDVRLEWTCIVLSGVALLPLFLKRRTTPP